LDRQRPCTLFLMVDDLDRERQISPLGWGVALAAVFGIERVILAMAGVRFNAEALVWYWQVLDPVLLRENLLESLP